MLPEVPRPLAHGHPADAHPAGDLRLRKLARSQQLASCQTAFFTLGPGEVSRSPDHGCLL